MQLVVVIAVRAAVIAATSTFRMSSQMLFFFIAADPLPNPCLRREWGPALLCGAAMTFSLCSKVSSRP